MAQQSQGECFCLDSSVPCNVTTHCGHPFHQDCLWGWVLRGNNTCPVCRAVLVAQAPQQSLRGPAPQRSRPRSASLVEAQRVVEQAQQGYWYWLNLVSGNVLTIYSAGLLWYIILQYGGSESPWACTYRYFVHDHWLCKFPLEPLWFKPLMSIPMWAIVLMSRLLAFMRLLNAILRQPLIALVVYALIQSATTNKLLPF